MTEADWQALGRIVREMQAEMRTMRTENALVRHAIVDLATLINDRIAQFETRIDERLTRIEERLARIERRMKDNDQP